MRFFEIIIFILLFLSSIQLFLPGEIKGIKKARLMLWIGITSLAVIVLHLIFEGAIWQMVPAYILTGFFFILASIGYIKLRQSFEHDPDIFVKERLIKSNRRRLIAKGITSSILILLIVLAGIIPVVIPMFDLPKPTGTYTIGTTTFQLTDNSRYETFTEDSGDYRKLLIRVWYPTDLEVTRGHFPAPYLKLEYATALGPMMGLPDFTLGHLAQIPSNSFEDVPVSQQESNYPVLIFSHGYGQGYESQNIVLMEELASHGYIVFSISHTYESAITVFPDGNRTTCLTLEELLLKEEELDYENDLLNNISSPDLSIEEKKTALYDLSKSDLWGNRLNESLAIWTNDTRFLIDQLEISNNPNIPNIFDGKLDLDLIGLFGHFFGGATAGETCLLDNRIDAGINMDGLEIGHIFEMNLTKPFMFMYSSPNNFINDILYLQAENRTYSMVIEGTFHFNYADACIFSPYLKHLGIFGSIDGYRMLKILNEYVVAFFNKYLKGETVSLLDSNSVDYPEVKIENNGK